MRGEYTSHTGGGGKTAELPPRARRIPYIVVAAIISIGTTSACAENTTVPGEDGLLVWNYLRVRGEYPK